VSEQNAIARTGSMSRTRRVIGEEEAQRRRTRNRENMRRRRVDPAYRAFEKRRREEKHGGSARINSLEIMSEEPARVLEKQSRCAICRKRNAVEVVTRLRPSADAKGGYVQMRVAYCGFC
jgi:hypothetical protein